MAGDITIRLRGDATSLKSFYASVGRETDAFINQFQKSFKSQFTKELGLTGMTKVPVLDELGRQVMKFDDQLGRLVPKMKTLGGSSLGNIRTEFDALNNVIKVTAQTGLRLSNGQFFPTGTTTLIRGSVTEMHALNTEYAALLTKANEIKAAFGPQIIAAQRNTWNVSQAATATVRSDIAYLTGERQRLGVDSAQRQMAISDRYTNKPAIYGAASSAYDAKTLKMEQELLVVENQLAVATANLAAEEAKFQSIMANDAGIKAAKAAEAALWQQRAQQLNANQALLTKNRTAYNEMLRNPNVEAPVGYQMLPPSVLKKLDQARVGLASTGKALYEQNASFDTPIRNLETGLTTFSGALDRTIMIQGRAVTANQKWRISVDDSGKVVETMGRQFRGLSRITDQISRDFQKVIEWTVATTVVFGGMAAAAQGLTVIKDLDANLTRLSVTANLTTVQTQDLYKSLFEIAQSTATPLEQLVKSADDLALAVKKPGQTAEQLTTEIKTLAEAVGIYTNLTGTDTVAATEQLTAVMKQLGMTATEVFTVLNKVTAAAGGQSTTIEEITKALSVMAESGKTANLNIDQEIGVVKTLSQVTGKSASEVATSFKNLVGALENPAAIKALKALGIATISEGNTIIGVYEEIAKKVRTGDIAPGALSGLLRSISGGPRRAPDAAALLANIDQVLRETTVSANATNEAFMANAKVLDTMNAKITQFQNLLKDKAYEKFGAFMKESLGSILSLATAAVNAFASIPNSVFALLAQIVALTAAVALLKKGLSLLGISQVFGSMNLSFSGLKANIMSLVDNVRILGMEMKANGVGSALGMGGSLINGRGLLRAGGSALLGGAVGAGFAAASGGSWNQVAGSALMGAGGALMAIPSGYTQIAGGIALVGGAILSLIPKSEAATSSIEKNADAITAAAQAAKSASEQLDALGKAEATISAQIKNYEAIPANKRSADDQSALNDLYIQYAKAINDAAEAQRALNAATDDFKKATVSLGLGEQVQAALQDLNSPEAKRVIEAAQASLMKTFAPGLQTGNEVKKYTLSGQSAGLTGPSPYGIGGSFYTQTSVSNQRQILDAAMGGKLVAPQYQNSIMPIADLEKFLSVSGNVSKLFDSNGTFNADIEVTAKNFDLIRKAIDSIPDEGLKNKLSGSFEQFAAGKDDITAAAQALNYYGLQAKALTQLGFADVGNQIDAITKKFANYQTEALGAGIDKNSVQSNMQQVLDTLYAATKNRTPIPQQDLNAMANMLASLSVSQQHLNLNTEEYKALVEVIGSTLPGWASGYDSAISKAQELSDVNQKVFDDLTKSLDSLVTGYAQKGMGLFADFKGGSLSGADYGKQTAELNALAAAAIKVRDSLNSVKSDSFKAAFDSILKDASPTLQKLPGWLDASNMSMEDFINRAFAMADSMNLSAKQTAIFQKRIQDLIAAVARIANIKTTYGISASVDVRSAIAALVALRKATAAAMMTGGRDEWQANKRADANPAYSLAGLDAAIAALQQAQNQSYSSMSGVTSIIGSGSGSSRGGGGSSSRRNVSTLDLPDLIANAGNRSSLIQQAIANAKSLQSKIPGATRDARNDIVELLKGTQRILEVRGVKEEYLRKALEELAAVEQKRIDMESKADTLRRIRVGAGDFSAIANVPVNSVTGIGMAGPTAINITLNGQVMTPAQMEQFANQIAAALKRQIANG